LAYIAAVLKKEEYGVEIYSQDVHHFSDENLTYNNWIWFNGYGFL
jgi:hypothetical protein